MSHSRPNAATAAKQTSVGASYADISALADQVRDLYRIDRAIEDSLPVTLKGASNVRTACCPFHVEKTPSFNVDVRKGFYKCFGSGCGARGDVFTLLQEVYSVGFREAVMIGADRCGVVVPDSMRKRGDTPVRPRAARPAPRPEAAFEIPVNLAPHGLIAASPGMRQALPGRRFPVWQDGGRDGDKPYEVKNYRPARVHDYRDVHGNLLMSVLRLEFSDRKIFIPIRLAEPSGDCPAALLEKPGPDGRRLAWINEGPAPGTKRPVYGMDRVDLWSEGDRLRVIVVEGEKTCDAGHRMFAGAYPEAPPLVVTPMGGSSGSAYADWAPLLAAIDGRDVHFVIWPDADHVLKRHDGTMVNRQKKSVSQVATSILQAAVDGGVDLATIRVSGVVPPQDRASGWDLADAEQEKWTPEGLRLHVRKNLREVSDEMVNLRPAHAGARPEIEETGREVPDHTPFEDRHGDADAFDASWADALDGEVPNEPDDDVIVLDAEPDPVHAMVLDGDIESDFETGNPHFTCLGYHGGAEYFRSLQSHQVFSMTARHFTPANLLHIAPLDWWTERFGEYNARSGKVVIDWTSAYDYLIRNCYRAGVWDPRMEFRQGARIDGKDVVFHTGTKLHVVGRGTLGLADFDGRYCYTIGPSARTPDFANPFPSGAPEVKAYLDILSSLDWRGGTREISIMALFGWVMISPICGILKWRPHLWLDGPRSSGKSWIVRNLVKQALGGYAEEVVSNSSESGIRNLLDARAMPIVFDEAEGEDRESRARMDAILRLARHSASEGDSVVAQGVSGGGAMRYYSIASSFLMTSIMPQLEASADKTRFARARLASGRRHDDFAKHIENPAAALLTETFSDRLVARMVMRAGSYHATVRLMVQALSLLGMERRLADVYGAFATGSWLALRDGVPLDVAEATLFVTETFDVVEQIMSFNEDVGSDKDHHRVFREIASREVRIETRNFGARTVQVGTLLEVACGYQPEGEDPVVSQDEARAKLLSIGFACGDGPVKCRPEAVATTVLIHKNSAAIRDMMDKTPYARSFMDVIHQAENVTMGPTTRFGAALGVSRTLVVPIGHFSIGVDG